MPFGSFGPGAGGGVTPDEQVTLDPPIAMVITLASLAAGFARQSDYVNNSTLKRQAAKLTVEIQANAAPTNGTICEVWLLRTKSQALAGLLGDDGTGPTDAAYPMPLQFPRNATMIGAINVDGTTTIMRGTFDTSQCGPLGDFWGIAISNRYNVPLAATGNSVTYETY